MSSEEFEKLHEIYRSLYEELKLMPERVPGCYGGKQCILAFNANVSRLSTGRYMRIWKCKLMYLQKRGRGWCGPSMRGRGRQTRWWVDLIVTFAKEVLLSVGVPLPLQYVYLHPNFPPPVSQLHLTIISLIIPTLAEFWLQSGSNWTGEQTSP